MNRKIKMKFCLGLVIVLGWTSLAVSQTSTVTVENGYVRGLPPGVQNTSAYMTLVNPTDTAVMLTGARSTSANSVTIHKTEAADGMMHMSHMSMLTIDAHSEVSLETGDLHLMLMGLKSPLATGSVVDITLVFQNGTEQTVNLPVRSVLDE